MNAAHGRRRDLVLLGRSSANFRQHRTKVPFETTAGKT
jgi:hypothetical protein